MNKKILLIDDDEDEQWIFTEALKEISNSITCLYAITAKEGLELSKQSLPDYIFIDINMPFSNGLQCLELIKSDDRLKEIPVIIYSTGINNTVIYAAMNKGAFACIKKENTIDDLAKKLKILFAEKGLHKHI